MLLKKSVEGMLKAGVSGEKGGKKTCVDAFEVGTRSGMKKELVRGASGEERSKDGDECSDVVGRSYRLKRWEIRLVKGWTGWVLHQVP